MFIIITIIILGFVGKEQKSLTNPDLNPDLNKEINNPDINNKKSIKKNNPNKPINIENILNDIKENHEKLTNFKINPNDIPILYTNIKKKYNDITLNQVKEKYPFFEISKDYFLQLTIFNDHTKNNISKVEYSIYSLNNTLNELDIFQNTQYKEYLFLLEQLLKTYKIYKKYLEKKYLENNITE